MKKALFLDRDGVINIDSGYVHKIESFKFVEGIFDLCKYYQNLGYIIIVITNQAGVSKGKFQETDFYHLNEWMKQQFLQNGITITQIYFEFSSDESNFNRKPNPGMFIKAVNDHNIIPELSVMVGDKISDLIPANAVGIKTLYLLKSKYQIDKVTFDYHPIDNLSDIIIKS